MNSRQKGQLASLSVVQLQTCLEVLGCRKTGKKDDLRTRIMATFEERAAMGAGGALSADEVNQMDRVQQLISSISDQRRPADKGQRTIPGSLASLPLSAVARLLPPCAPRPPSSAAPRSAPPPQQHSFPSHQDRGGGGGGAAAGPSPSAPGVVYTRTCPVCQARPTVPGRMVPCGGCGREQHTACCARMAHGATLPRAVRFCEACHLARADPFWEPLEAGFLPTLRLQSTGQRAQSGISLQVVQQVDQLINLTPAQCAVLQQRDSPCRLQLTCLLVDDPVPFRCHWPLSAGLHVNDMLYRVYGRPASTKLGQNQRDEGATLNALLRPAHNRLRLRVVDDRTFVVLLQLVRPRSLQLVEGLMRPTNSLDQALTRVVREIRGDDDDEEVETTHTTVSLRCPLTGSRIRRPARFVDVPGLACFDLDAFLDVAQRTRKWQCPHSMRNSCLDNLQVDAYMERVLACLQGAPRLMEVDVSPAGQWRPSGRPGAPWLNVHGPYDNLPRDPVKRPREERTAHDSDTSSSGSSGDSGDGRRRGGVARHDAEEEHEQEAASRPTACPASGGGGVGAGAGRNAAAQGRSRAEDAIVIDDDSGDEEATLRPMMREGVSVAT